MLILDAHHLSCVLSRRSLMAAASWRSSRSLLVHAAPLSRRGLSQFAACAKVQGGRGVCRGPAQAVSFRRMAAVSVRAQRDSFDGLVACRAADRDGEQEGEFELARGSSVAVRNGECLESARREGSDFVRENAGGIHVIVGPMFAGKTTALLKRIRKEADAGRWIGFLSLFFLFF